MEEFKLHHLVQQLLETAGLTDDAPKDFVEFLQKKITTDAKATASSPIIIQSLVQQLSQASPEPDKFLAKVEDLKTKNVDGLAEYIQILSYISQDSGLKDFLQKSNKKVESFESHTSLAGNTPVTVNDLQQVKTRLKKAVSKKSQHKELVDRSKIFDRSLVASLASTTSVTSWVQRRPSMSWDFSSQNLSNSIKLPIENIPIDSQENLLIEDLLNVLIGLPGCCIEPLKLRDPYAPREFFICEAVEPSLKELVKQILPLASHYSVVQRFIEEKMRFEFGQVCNALAECMSSLTVDYTLFITQLETEARSGNLNLHKMWFYIQKNLHSMSIMSNIATCISKSDAKGGKVLSLLHDHVTGIGDSKAQQLCLYLMQATCVPYMKMLGMWIYMGIISDPINEFLVEDNEVVQKEDMPVDYSADYWEKKYTIRRERIPKFLEPVSDIILRAGKYLNVIRQCGKSINNRLEPIEYKIEQKDYLEAIEKAYKFASRTLLDLVLREQDLLGRLKSVKHYFLLDQGDFIVTFLTLCEKELNKDVVDVIQGRLESLLDLALRLSSSNNDPYKDDLRTELLPYELQYQMLKILTVLSPEEKVKSEKNTQLTVIESFAFSYEVRWPLSLILNRRSLACYQMIFRHLFYCKHVERMMCQVWRSNKVAKAFPFSAAQQYRSAFALRQRMLHCIQNLEYHMMVEVIEPHWCLFMQRIARVNNIDEVLLCHSDFLDSCLKDCMLTIPNLLTTITNILSICVRFCKFMQKDSEEMKKARLRIREGNGINLVRPVLSKTSLNNYRPISPICRPKLICSLKPAYPVKPATSVKPATPVKPASSVKSVYLVKPLCLLKPVCSLNPVCLANLGESAETTVNVEETPQPPEVVKSFKSNVDQLDLKFSEALKDLLDQINGLNKDTSDYERLYNLLYRLDFNSFYTGKFEKLRQAAAEAASASG